MTSTLVNGVEKMRWTIRILFKSLQHVFKMYTWFLSENQTSVQFTYRLIGLLIKESLFRKHDFATCVYKVYQNYQNLGFWHWKFFFFFSPIIRIILIHTSEKMAHRNQPHFNSMMVENL